MIETAVKERPIIFSAPMIQAILDGRKTQARRIVKPQPTPAPIVGWWVEYDTPREKHYSFDDDVTEHIFHEFNCPYGTVGSRLYVKESFYYDICPYANGGNLKEKPAAFVAEALYYRADGECCEQIPECECGVGNKTKWRPSIHMPRWASRILLEITDVRVERLKDISQADAEAEGVTWDDTFVVMGPGHIKVPKSSPRSAFTKLWDSIHGQGEENPKSWDANPWVWVIEFKRVTP